MGRLTGAAQAFHWNQTPSTRFACGQILAPCVGVASGVCGICFSPLQVLGQFALSGLIAHLCYCSGNEAIVAVSDSHLSSELLHECFA